MVLRKPKAPCVPVRPHDHPASQLVTHASPQMAAGQPVLQRTGELTIWVTVVPFWPVTLPVEYVQSG